MKGPFPVEKLLKIETPFYYYDTSVLRETLREIQNSTERYNNFHVHYAIKANANQHLLPIICAAGMGADCVSGGEIKAALHAGFPADKIVKTGLYAYCVGGRYGLMDAGCHRLTEPLYKDIFDLDKNIFRAILLDYSSEVILNSKGEVMR